MMKGGLLLKVCDFGTAGILRTMMTVNKGSPCWIAPEILKGAIYNEKCDVYSYSIVAWEMIVRLRPYFHMPNATQHVIMFGVSSDDRLRPKAISNCPKLFKLFFQSCWSNDPNKRPSMEFIFRMMTKLDCIINRDISLQPLVKQQAINKQSVLIKA